MNLDVCGKSLKFLEMDDEFEHVEFIQQYGTFEFFLLHALFDLIVQSPMNKKRSYSPSYGTFEM